MQPRTSYTTVAGSQVAYQVVGDGPIDIVNVTGLVGNVDMQWEFPPMAHVLERLASFSRLITFDRRGSGVSDPIRLETLPSWEHWTEDLTAVLDAAGSERTAILASRDAGAWGILFAATFPSRTSALVVHNAWARSLIDDDYALGWSPEVSEATIEMVAEMWGTEDLAALAEPSFAGDPAALRWMAKFMRGSITPSASRSLQLFLNVIDVRGVLGTIQAPTLVLHQPNPYWSVEMCRYIAEHIPGARFASVPGNGVFLLGEGADETLDLVEEFLTGTRPARPIDRVLATIVFTDVVGSTQRAFEVGDRRWKQVLDRHDANAKGVFEASGGRIIQTDGDGVLATFDAPGRAIRAVFALKEVQHESGIDIRTGVHTGEIELRGDGGIAGIGVHIAARVMDRADGGEVLCSRTVKDLVVGSGIEFDDRGTHALKGVPDEWQLFAVREA